MKTLTKKKTKKIKHDTVSNIYHRQEHAEVMHAMGHADDAEEYGEHQCVVDAILGRED